MAATTVDELATVTTDLPGATVAAAAGAAAVAAVAAVEHWAIIVLATAVLDGSSRSRDLPADHARRLDR